MPAEKELKKIPGFSQGVRLNSAMRMVKLAAPVCPNSQRKRNVDGTFAYVGQNCQLLGGKWWEYCEQQGHNPYFSKQVNYESVDVTDDEGFITGVKKKRVEIERPNIVQVPLARRMHSGQGVKNSMEKKGRRRLSDLGYEEVCQLRNCQNVVVKKYTTPAFGAYCSFEHMIVVAADAQEIMLPRINGVTKGARIGQVRQKRDDLLRRATVNTLE